MRPPRSTRNINYTNVDTSDEEDQRHNTTTPTNNLGIVPLVTPAMPPSLMERGFPPLDPKIRVDYQQKIFTWMGRIAEEYPDLPMNVLSLKITWKPSLASHLPWLQTGRTIFPQFIQILLQSKSLRLAKTTASKRC